MKWLTNATKKMTFANVLIMNDETQEEAYRRELKFRQGLFLGRPQATKSLTVGELEEMNIVGLYEFCLTS